MTYEETQDLVKDILSGYIYDVLPSGLMKQVEKVIDFETLENHLVAEILTITGDRPVTNTLELVEV